MKLFRSTLFGTALTIGSISANLSIAQDSSIQTTPAAVKPKLKDLDGHFPFTPPASKEDWEKRAEEVRTQLKVALGIHPMPRLPALNPVVHSAKEMDGYRVEKVIIESFPGLFVTGTLYRPLTTKAGGHPVMLCPHGHWANARFYDPGQAEIHRLLANGEERFANAARNHIQARCVQLARMGCVVFQWDMLGYSDSQQISMQRAHGFKGKEAGDETNDQGWVLFSPEAEGYAQSVMGIQTVHTWRAVDFVLSLPEVDSKRVGITGASGGGTQTFVASALDPRISLSFPAVMVSTGMQGGCTCENACGLRVDTGNIELAGLFAPKPMGITAADDWTKTMPKDGFPELKKLYELYGAADKVALFPSLHYGHNYNHVSRVSMYGWVNRFFELGLPTPVLERDFEYLSGKELTVWDDRHPMPPGGLGLERSMLRWWKDDAEAQLLNSKDTQASRSALNQGWDTILAPARRMAEQMVTKPGDGDSLSIEWQGTKVAHVERTTDVGKGPCFVFGSASGQSDSRKELVKMVRGDGFLEAEQGELSSFQYLESEEVPQGLVANPRRSAAYTFGYNPPLLVRKAAAATAALRQWSKLEKKPMRVYATSRDAFVAAAVCKLCPEAVAELTIVDVGDRLADAKDIDDPRFVPASLKYQDWPGLIACLESSTRLVKRSAKHESHWKKLQEAGLLKHVHVKE